MAATTAKTALGATITVTPSGGSAVVLANVTNISPNKITRETIEASDLSTTGGMEYIAEGLYDGGTISVAFDYVAGNTDDAALHAAILAGTLCAVKMVVKSASATFDLTRSNCIITEYGPDAFEVKGKQTGTITFKVSGDVSQAATA